MDNIIFAKIEFDFAKLRESGEVCEVLMGKAREQGKKEDMLAKIVDGQMKKFVAESCLLEQAYIKNPDIKIADYLKETIAKIGENIVIRRFVRFGLGEGIEKKKDDFAAEVAAQAKV